MTQGRAMTGEQQERFLAHLRASANVSAAAAVIGWSRSGVYGARDRDTVFAEAWADAIEEATDALEGEARRRAIEGTEEYVTCKDGLVRDANGSPVMQRRYSDTLMVQLLRAHRPDKYWDRSTVDLNVNGDLAARIEEGRKRARGEKPADLG